MSKVAPSFMLQHDNTVVSPTHLSTLAARVFPVTASWAWNSLPNPQLYRSYLMVNEISYTLDGKWSVSLQCCALIDHFLSRAVDISLTTKSECYSEIEIEQGLSSHQTHYRSYRVRFLQVIWPNQQCQSTEGNQLVLQIRPESHQDHSTMLQ